MSNKEENEFLRSLAESIVQSDNGRITRHIIPRKCCYNCINGIKYKVPQEPSDVREWAIEFNASKRVCGANYNQPSYPMYEERMCRNFEDRLEEDNQ